MLNQSKNLAEVETELRERNATELFWLLEASNYEIVRGLISAPIISLAASLCLLNPWLVPVPVLLSVVRFYGKSWRWYRYLALRHRRVSRYLTRSFECQYSTARQVCVEEVLAASEFVRAHMIRHYFDYTSVAVGVVVLNALGGHLGQTKQAAQRYIEVVWSWHLLLNQRGE